MTMTNKGEIKSSRPYFIRAIYEWCVDNHLTPYIVVKVDDLVQVPREHVHDGEIVFNISYDATSGLSLGDDFIEFKARFNGVARQLVIPVTHIAAIYARESGEGMAFSDIQGSYGSLPDASASAGNNEPGHAEVVLEGDSVDLAPSDAFRKKQPGVIRPSLRLVK